MIIASLAVMMLWGACDKDSVKPADTDGGSTEDTFGSRYEVHDVSEENDLTFPVNSTFDMDISEVGTNLLNIEKKQIDGQWHITLSCREPEKLPLTSLAKLHIRLAGDSKYGKGEMEFDKMIVLRNSDLIKPIYSNDEMEELFPPQPETKGGVLRTSYTDIEKEILYKSPLMSKLGHSVNLALQKPYETAMVSVFDMDLLQNKRLISITPETTTELKVATGEHYEDTFEKRNASFGLGGFGPLGGRGKGWTFGASMDYSESKSTESKKYHLYDTRDYMAIKFKSHLDPLFNAICDAADHESRLSALDTLMKYADRNFINSLNRIKINTVDEAKKVLMSYGTHVVTAGIFGAKMMSQYDQHEDSYYESIEHSAGVQLSAKQSNGGKHKVDKILTALGYNNKSSIEASASGDDAFSNLIRNTECNFDFRTIGGPSELDPETFVSGITYANSAMIAFNITLATDVDGNTLGLPNYGLVPIWYFFTDENEQKLLINAFESLRESLPERAPLVLADVVYKFYEFTHNGDEAESKNYNKYIYPYEAEFFTGGKNHKLTYYPMIPNKMYDETQYMGRNDAVFDILTKEAGGCVYSGMGVFYYAMGRADEVDGIKDIKFVKKGDLSGEAGKGYVRRGNASNEGLHIVGRYPVYVMVQYGDLNGRKPADYNDLVTGFAVSGKNNGEIFASTAGTIYTRNHSFNGGKNIFQYYYDGTRGSQSWADYMGGAVGVWDFYPFVTKKALIDSKGNPIENFSKDNLPEFKWFEKGTRWN